MSPIEIEVEIGCESDFEEIFSLLVLMHQENGVAPLDAERVWNTMRGVEDHGQILVARYADWTHEIIVPKIIGTMGVKPQRYWYSEEQYVTDLWTFVHPMYRRTSCFADLIEEAKKIAASAGLPLQLGISSPHRLAAKIRLYRRHGFKLTAALMKED